MISKNYFSHGHSLSRALEFYLVSPGVIARISGCKRDFLVRFFQEIFDHRDHSLLFPKQGEVAGIRD